MQDYFDYFSKGGPIMWPILACSLIAVTVFIERLLAYRLERVFPKSFAESILDLVKRQEFSAAESLARQQSCPVSAITLACLETRASGRSAAKERMEEVGSVEVSLLNRYLGALSAIVTVSPLLGLLGTVTGMVQVFQSVASVDDPRISQLAGGIWEALLTTVAGLAVAIPAYLGFRYLESRLDRLADGMQAYGVRLLDLLYPPAAAASQVNAEQGSKPARGEG